VSSIRLQSKKRSDSFSPTCTGVARGWNARRSLREDLLSDGRRFSYKSLNDRKRAAASCRFLEATDSIPGLAVVILVEKTIAFLFKSSGHIESSDPEIKLLPHWSPRVVERLLRVCHFVAFFLADLSREHQDILSKGDCAH
jgi:hypothetical protein